MTVETDKSPSDGLTGDEKLLADAKAHYKICEEAWGPNRRLALEDIRFAKELEQWPEAIKKKRENDRRPCLTVDKLNQYIRQVVNDGRQNRPGVKVRPVSNGHADVAEAYEGLIRDICDRSNADEAFDTALDHAATGGFGWIRVCTDYSSDRSFDQDIRVERIRNCMAVMLDPNAQKADGSDAKFGFVIDELSKEEFEDKYPKAEKTDWEFDTPSYGEGWIQGEKVRVAEYFYVVEKTQEVHKLENGLVMTDDDYKVMVKERGAEAVPKIVDTREIPVPMVKWCRLTGAEVLEKQDWAGKYIPIVPVYGNEADINGRVIYSGLVRSAKDAQRVFNYSRTAYAERVALTPKAPYIAAAGQVEEYPEWEDANTENYSVLRYTPLENGGSAVPPPQRQPPSDVPAGFAQDMQLAEHDIQASMGMYAANLGQPSNEKSGKAILARQREGDVGTFHYQDNLNRAIRYLGRILVDLIPKIYDAPRTVRLLSEDGTAQPAQVDPRIQAPVQQMGALKIYNLAHGIYDVSIESGPSYTTKRQESLDAMMQLTQANPQLFQLIGDIMVRNADWPGAQQIADRLKLMLPPPIQQAEQGQNPMPPEVQQAMQQIQQGQQQLTQAHQQLQAMAAQLAQDKAATDAQKVKLEAMKQQLDAADKILQANYQELSAKLELEAMKLATQVPQVMPPGTNEPAINPNSPSGLSVSGA
jgi:hypothetical protein